MTHHKNNQIHPWHHWPFLLVMVLTFIVAVMGVYHYVNESPDIFKKFPSHKSVKSIGETSTYTNTQYGFETKIPQNWTATTSTQSGFTILCLGEQGKQYVINLTSTCGVDIQIHKSDLSCDNCITAADLMKRLNKPQEVITLDGDIPADLQKGSDFQVLFDHNGFTFRIHTFVPGQTGPVFDQILSTFKFVQPMPNDIQANANYKAWLKQVVAKYKISQSLFSPEASSEIKIVSQQVYNGEAACEQVDEYSLKVVTSPDKQRFVCFGNGGEPDSILLLYDKVAKRSGELESCGTICSYDAAFWLGNTRLIFLVTNIDTGAVTDKFIRNYFVVTEYDFAKNTVTKWTAHSETKK